MPEALVICDNLFKIYTVADLEVVALQGLDLEVMPGEMLAIVGVSSSGKTTLLNILSSLDVPSAGKCMVDGNDLTRLSQAQRIRYERFTLPKEALEHISFNGHAEIRIVDDHVELWPLGTGMNEFSLDGEQQVKNQATA